MPVKDVLILVQVLAPLLEDLYAYIKGGKRPVWIDTLPATSRSRVLIEVAKARKNG